MFKFRLLFALLLLATSLHAATPKAAPEPQKILMIGNSLTYTYGIPKILEKFAEASKKKLEITAHTAGGKSLAWHWETPNKEGGLTAKQAIEKGGYDLVILQEFSNGLIKKDYRDTFDKLIADYVKTVHSKNMKAMLYMAHPTAKEIDPDHLKPIVDGISKAADELKVPCSPVVLAFIKCNEKYPKLALIDNQKDRKYGTGKAQTHQSPFGSYLAACTLYATIYNQSPVGLKFHAAFDAKTEFPIDPADAKAAQEIAWEVHQHYTKKHKQSP